MSRRDEVRAELQGLPLEKREAITAALYRGRAVHDEQLAPLAAAWAAERQDQMLRTYVIALVPLTVIAVALLLWLLTSNDREASLVGALYGAISAGGLAAAITWAVTWRPLVRAEKANLALASVEERPRRREPSRWVVASLALWPIAVVIGVVAHAVSIPVLAGSLAFVVWFALVRLVDNQEPRRHTVDGEGRSPTALR